MNSQNAEVQLIYALSEFRVRQRFVLITAHSHSVKRNSRPTH